MAIKWNIIFRSIASLLLCSMSFLMKQFFYECIHGMTMYIKIFLKICNQKGTKRFQRSCHGDRAIKEVQKETNWSILNLNYRRLGCLKVHIIKKSLVLMVETLDIFFIFLWIRKYLTVDWKPNSMGLIRAGELGVFGSF